MTQTLFNGAYHIKTNIAADYITLEAGRQKIRPGGGTPVNTNLTL